MLESLLSFGRKIIPKGLFLRAQPLYHYFLALLGALVYRFPSRQIKVIGITGTKGKTTTTELINAILEEAGYITALSNTIRFKVSDTSRRNTYKMSMPGRFFMQKFLRDAVSNRCDYAVLEMTSEGVSLSRHRFIALDALVFTNLSPEHIEAHGSFEKYRDAKRKLGLLLENSRKSWRAIIANTDDAEGMFYLGLSVPRSFPYSLAQAQPHKKTAGGFVWTFRGELIESRLPGIFNLYNTLAAATFAVSQDIKDTVIKRALESFSKIRGRVEYVDEGQSFATVVDYAHTIDSLKQFYEIFSENHNICVLGNTGGGRDSWKRKGMAKVAETHCNHIILTNEDPYDEDPASIVDQMSEGITKKDKLSVVMDRREAIAVALKMANTLEREKGPGNKGVNVLITGKGTDPYIMGAGGHKEPWDDARVVREELRALLKKT